ncbi:MAG TPA: LamG-like jellyroll fold domain-containing protein [Pirellulales bacterium]|nr:LamG-like jellyroll fold domain-containing protein [Pirellulales bacterium]
MRLTPNVPDFYAGAPTPGTPIYPDSPQAFGLVGCWPMWEGAGQSVEDVSGFGNRGTIVGGMTWQPPAGPASPLVGSNILKDDGTSGYATLGQPAALNFNPTVNAFSVLVVFRHPNAAPAANEILVSKISLATTQVLFYIQQSSSALTGNVNTTAFIGTTNVCDGKWHVGIWSIPAASSGASIYLDGIAETFSSGTGAIASGTNSNDWLVGARRQNSNSDSSKWFTGNIAQVMIWNRALTKAEAYDFSTDPFAAWRWPRQRSFAPASSPIVQRRTHTQGGTRVGSRQAAA